MANLRTDRPGRVDGARRGDGWGTTDDARRADERRAAEEKRGAEALKRLLGRDRDSGRDPTGGHDRRRHVTPWLVIRYDGADLGYRPIPAGKHFWETTEIWVESPDLMGNPVAGLPNYVHALIWNLGAFDAAPVKVDFYWANPSLGLDAAHMHLIGSEYVEVKTLHPFDVRCNTPWVPLLVNGGHECLMVNCSNWIGDPILQPFHPVQDRHVGQRNVHVIAAPPGMTVMALLNLANLGPAPTTIELLATMTHIAPRDSMARDITPRELLARVLAFDAARGDDFALVRRAYDAPFLNLQFTGQSRFYDLSTRQAGTAHALSAGLAGCGPRGDPARSRASLQVAEALLRAGETKPFQLCLAIPAAARPFEFIVCRLFQVAHDHVVGGYTIVVAVAEG